MEIHTFQSFDLKSFDEHIFSDIRHGHALFSVILRRISVIFIHLRKKENTSRADITFQYRRIGGWLSTRCSQLSFQLFSFKKFSMLCFQNHIWIYPEVNTDFTGDLENGSFDLLWLFSPLSLSLLSPSQHVLLSQSHAILLLLSSLQAFSLSS